MAMNRFLFIFPWTYLMYQFTYLVGKPQKKVIFLVAGPLRGGGRLNGCATKEKRTFFSVRKKVPVATKPRGGGLNALVAGLLR